MDWQQLVVFLIVAGAAFYLWRRQVASRGRSACGGCGGCGGKQPATPMPRQPELVQLELTPRKSPGAAPFKELE